MKQIIYFLMLAFCSSAIAETGPWQAPTAYEDGTPLEFGQIDFFTIYASRESGANYEPYYIAEKCSTSATFELIESGEWFFVIKATDVNGKESAASNEVRIFVYSCADADLNGDQLVNAGDLAIMKSNFFQSGIGDINQDQIVNAADLAILKSCWTQ